MVRNKILYTKRVQVKHIFFLNLIKCGIKKLYLDTKKDFKFKRDEFCKMECLPQEFGWNMSEAMLLFPFYWKVYLLMNQYFP